MPDNSSVFPRNFRKDYPLAVRGEGCWIISADGRRFLDAAGQAAVINIGHGVAEIGQRHGRPIHAARLRAHFTI